MDKPADMLSGAGKPGAVPANGPVETGGGRLPAERRRAGGIPAAKPGGAGPDAGKRSAVLAPLPPLPALPSTYGAPHLRGRRGPARRPTLLPRFHLPWTVYGYIVGEVFRIFLLGVLAVSIFYTTLAAYQIVRSGLQLGFLWPLLAKTFAFPLHFSIPLGLLFGITLTIGRMNSDLESAALRTHGISHIHVYAPILALSLVLAVISFHVNGWMVPRIHFEKRNLEGYILNQLENLGSGVNRTILLPDGEGSLHVGAHDGTNLKRVMVELRNKTRSSVLPAIRKHLPEKLPSTLTIFANEGKVEIQPGRSGILLNLRSVQVCVPEPVRGAAPANDWFHQTLTITENVVIPLSFAPRRPGIKDMTTPELLSHRTRLREEALAAEGEAGIAFASYQEGGSPVADRVERARRRVLSASTEIHRRIALTVSVITFPLAAASLALLLGRWSRLVPFFFGNLVVVLIWYPLLIVGAVLGAHGVWPSLAMALPNVALIALSAVLIRKVVRL